MTKKDAATEKEAWLVALSEGRALKYSPTMAKSFPTIAARDEALATSNAEIVTPPASYWEKIGRPNLAPED